MKKWMVGGVACGALAVFSGCATGPRFQTPEPPKSESFGAVSAECSTELQIPESWWEVFQCETLNAAVGEALEKSPAQEQALARLKQAQEEYRAQSGATAYPSVDAGLSAKRQKVNPEAMGMENAPVPDPFAVYQASVSVSYDLDVFGRNRRVLEGLKAKVDQREFERDAARQTLAANVVLAFIRRAETAERIAAARDVVAARDEQFGMAEERRQAGGMSALDVERQGLLLEQARLLLPALENQEAQLSRQLAVYLGREPGEAIPGGAELSALQLPPALPLRLPSELARRRPDIRAAEAVWHQACANVGVATANLYPQFTLSASLGSQTTDLGDLLNNLNVWSVGGALMQPVFHGGALRAKKRAAVAACDEAAAAYRQTVLRGLQEVADVLGALEADARTLEAQEAVLARTAAAEEIARRQNEAGGLSRMALLDEAIRLRQARSEEARGQAARLADAAALFHALGGGAK